MEQQVGTNQLEFSSDGKGVEIKAQGGEGFILGVVKLIAELFPSGFIEKQSQKEE